MTPMEPNYQADTNTEPFSKKTVWILRIVLLVLFSLWVACVCYLRSQIRQDKAKLEQARIEASRHNDFLRRGAQYRQELNKFNQGVRSRSAFDER